VSYDHDFTVEYYIATTGLWRRATNCNCWTVRIGDRWMHGPTCTAALLPDFNLFCHYQQRTAGHEWRGSVTTTRTVIGVDLAWIPRGTHDERRRWVGAEWGGVWGGVSPLQPTKGVWGASWAPQRGSVQRPGRKRILPYFKGHRTLLFGESELTFTFAIGRRPSVCHLSVCLSVVCNVRAPYSGDW